MKDIGASQCNSLPTTERTETLGELVVSLAQNSIGNKKVKGLCSPWFSFLFQHHNRVGSKQAKKISAILTPGKEREGCKT